MDRLTSRQLRARAEAAGYALSGTRFNELCKAGLLPGPDSDGLWPPDVADRLVRIGELLHETRSRPRRALILASDGHAIPPKELLEAMEAIVPTILRPVTKMKRIRRSLLLLSSPETSALITRKRNRLESKGWQPPAPEDWRETLRQADIEFVRSRAGIWSYLVGVMRSDIYGADAIADIPKEEAYTLLAIRDISTMLSLRDKSSPIERAEA